MAKKIFLLGCEPSGDSHGAELVKELRALAPNTEFRGLGGPKMAAEGVTLLEDMTKFSALGFGDVLRQYFKYREVFYRALRDVETFKPDVIIPIDSPGFNLRFAKKINKRFPVLYYISPQIWAWGGRRIHLIKKVISKMLVILPFEVSLYQKAKVPCEFVGHPLLDQINPSKSREQVRAALGVKEGEYAIGLLPGSREKEVVRILPLMLKSAALLKKSVPSARFVLTPAPNVAPEIYKEILAPYEQLKITLWRESMHDLVANLDFALITSGTATLEAALLGTPFFLLYKASWSTYYLGKHLIRVPYLGLVNLLADRRVVPEFIQRDIHPETIAHETKVVLENNDLYEGMKKEFAGVKEKLGVGGASKRAAEAVIQFLDPNAPKETPAQSPAHN